MNTFCSKFSFLVILIMSLGGCAGSDPFQVSSNMRRSIDVTRPPCPTILSETEKSALQCQPTQVNATLPTTQSNDSQTPMLQQLPHVRYAGNIEKAIEAIDTQRQLYFDSMKWDARITSSLGLSMIVLSADAIYKGVTQSAAGRFVPKEAALFGGLYAAGTWLDIRPQEAVYAAGYQTLTCVLLQSRVSMMRVDEEQAFVDNLFFLQNDILDLDHAVTNLQLYWDLGEEDLRRRHAEHDQGSAGTKESNVVLDMDNLNREIGNAIKVLRQARKTYDSGNALLHEVNRSGYTLLEQGNVVVSLLSAEQAKNSPDLSTLKNLSSSFSSTTSPSISTLTSLSDSAADAGSTFMVPSRPETGKPPSGTQSGSSIAPGTTIDSQYQERARLRIEIAEEKARLYNDARKVEAVLLGMHDAYVQTQQLPECAMASGVPALAISPSLMPNSVKPTDVLTFHISGGTGIPSLILTGISGTSGSGASPLNSTLINGGIVSTVTIPKNAVGTLTLTASDQTKPTAQVVSVVIDVEGNAPEDLPPAVSITPTTKSIKLNFSTPSAKGGELTGYYVEISDGTAAGNYPLLFKTPNPGAAASAASVHGTVLTVSNGKTAIEIDGLVQGKTYTVAVTATFQGAADVEFGAVQNVKLLSVSTAPAQKKQAKVPTPPVAEKPVENPGKPTP